MAISVLIEGVQNANKQKRRLVTEKREKENESTKNDVKLGDFGLGIKKISFF